MNRGMAFRVAASFVVILMVSLPVAAAEEEGPDPVFGRVSAMEGNLLIQGADDDDWSLAELNAIVADGDTVLTEEDALAELEMPERVFLRPGHASGLDVVSIAEHQYRLWEGSLYVGLGEVPGRVVSVETESSVLVLGGEAHARLDIGEDGRVTVHALSGDIEVVGADGSTVAMRPNFRLRVSPEGAFVGLDAMDQVLADGPAQWHLQREAELAGTALPEFVPPHAVGVHELARAGDWIEVDGVRYWRPKTVEETWRPYYVGVWRYHRPVGYYWVPRYSFEYVTCHYGYWHHSAHYGWIWRPSWRRRPARVAWVVVSDGVMWAPIDYYHRPVVYYAPPPPRVSVSVGVSVGRPSGVSVGFWLHAPFDRFYGTTSISIVSRRTVVQDRVIIVDRGRFVRDIRTVRRLHPPRVVRARPLPPTFSRGHLSRRLDRRSRFVSSASTRWDRSRPAASRRDITVGRVAERTRREPGRTSGRPVQDFTATTREARQSLADRSRADGRTTSPESRRGGPLSGTDRQERSTRSELRSAVPVRPATPAPTATPLGTRDTRSTEMRQRLEEARDRISTRREPATRPAREWSRDEGDSSRRPVTDRQAQSGGSISLRMPERTSDSSATQRRPLAVPNLQRSGVSRLPQVGRTDRSSGISRFFVPGGRTREQGDSQTMRFGSSGQRGSGR